jgi:peroxiredoxin family protein
VCVEAGVNLVACQMTVDLFGYTRDDFIPAVKDWIGAASFLPVAQQSDVCLFI